MSCPALRHLAFVTALVLFQPLVRAAETPADARSESDASETPRPSAADEKDEAPTSDSGTHAAPGRLAPSFGHVVSSTTALLDRGQCTVGFQVAACGSSDRFTFGTSPWLFYDYGLASAFARVGFGRERSRPDGRYERSQAAQIAFFRNYVGSDDGRGFGYDMSALWGSYVWAFAPAPQYTVYLNAQLMHYWIDRYPFSLRRPWTDRTPLQANATLLIESPLSHGFHLNGEVGVLGVVQERPVLHAGVSVDWRSPSWLVRVGVSHSGTWRAWRNPTRRRDHQQDLRGSPLGFDGIVPEYAQYDYSVHPELTAQWYF